MQNDFSFAGFSLVFPQTCNNLTTTKVAFNVGYSNVCNKRVIRKVGIFENLSLNGHLISAHLDFCWILPIGLFTGVNPYPI